jgi:hypothetical protein
MEFICQYCKTANPASLGACVKCGKNLNVKPSKFVDMKSVWTLFYVLLSLSFLLFMFSVYYAS